VRQPDFTRAHAARVVEPKVELEEGLTKRLDYFRKKV
jgi:hypothetical protein